MSRYIHRNPVRCKRPLVGRPEAWLWSSYAGYRWNSKRLDWVAYETVYRAWQGERGGKHPEAAYRRFVEAGIDHPPQNPFSTAIDGWLLGSQAFADRIKRLMKSPQHRDEVPAARRLEGVPLAVVLQQTADHFGVDVASFARKASKQPSRDIAAWLARRLTVATLRDLMEPFGLGHPDSVRSLLGRAESAMRQSAKLRKQVEHLRDQIRDGT